VIRDSTKKILKVISISHKLRRRKFRLPKTQVRVVKKKTSISLDVELLKWVEEMIELKRFSSLTQAIEYGLQRIKENQKEELHT
jgi:hypothetical protein